MSVALSPADMTDHQICLQEWPGEVNLPLVEGYKVEFVSPG